MSCSHNQELCQLADLTSEWLFTLFIANQEPACLLTHFLTMTTTHKFPCQGELLGRVQLDLVAAGLGGHLPL